MKEDLYFFGKPVKEPPFWLDLAGISYCDKNYKITRLDSTETVLEYIVEGVGFLNVEGKDYVAEEGDVYLIRQGTNHFYYSDAKNPWVKIFFNIKGTLAERILDEYEWDDLVLIKNARMETEFREMLAKVSDSSRTQAEIFDGMAVDFLRTVIHLIRFHAQNSAESDGRNPLETEEMNRLYEYINAHLDRVVSNEELADLIFRSKDYCIKKFTAAFGTTPHQYQIIQKIAVARSMLRDGNKSVSYIASSLGYGDSYYFSSLFKQHTGVSPYRYRKDAMEIIAKSERNMEEKGARKKSGMKRGADKG